MSDPREDHPTPPTSRRAAREAAGLNDQSVPVDPPAVPDVSTAAPVPVAANAAITQDVPMVPSDAQTPPARVRRDEAHGDDKPLTDMADLFAAAPQEARVKKSQGRKRRTGCLVWLIVLVVLAGGLTAAGFVVNNVYGEQIREKLGWGEPKDYDASQAPGPETTVTISDGDTGEVISQTLFDAGVTKTSDALYDHLVGLAEQPPFFPGVYELQTKLPAAVAVEQLLDPARKLERAMLIKEGWSAALIYPELATALGVSEADVKAAAADPSVYGVAADSLEGWLFPATYTFDEGTTAQQAIQRMVDRAVQSLDDAGVPVADRQRILTVASIIQREGKTMDFPKVARVIYNRMDGSNNETFGKLQMDSTAQYGYGELHAGAVGSSQEALDDKNPWNTYQIVGLPIGPIASPGDAAIDAAMHPAEGPWLYFVTVNLDTGETIFTNTYAEHLTYVDQWRAWCAENPDSGCYAE